MQIAVLTGRCPVSKVADVMVCASGYQDATPCCEAYGVFEPGKDFKNIFIEKKTCIKEFFLKKFKDKGFLDAYSQ